MKYNITNSAQIAKYHWYIKTPKWVEITDLSYGNNSHLSMEKSQFTWLAVLGKLGLHRLHTQEHVTGEPQSN